MSQLSLRGVENAPETVLIRLGCMIDPLRMITDIMRKIQEYKMNDDARTNKAAVADGGGEATTTPAERINTLTVNWWARAEAHSDATLEA